MFERSLAFFSRVCALLLCLLSVIVFISMPSGFLINDILFWSHVVAPLALLIYGIAWFMAVEKDKHDWVAAFVFTASSTVLLSMVLLFLLLGFDGHRLTFVVLVSLFISFVSACVLFVRLRPALSRIVLLHCAVLPFAGAVVLSQFSGLPETQPLNTGHTTATAPALVATNMVDAERGEITLTHRGVTMHIDPLLRFRDWSSHGFWSIACTDEQRTYPELQTDHGAAGLRWLHKIITYDMQLTAQGERLDVLVNSNLKQDVYAHLNHFLAIQCYGHTKLHISFSALSEELIEVTHMEYPSGAPARFAYCPEPGVLHVVEASDAEKGPFKILATGRFGKEPLWMYLFDAEELLYAVNMSDWAAQLSYERSPTAGWGIPVNAIEFSRAAISPKSSAFIWCTLAGTSVGRGFQTVGHRAGSYRNNVTIVKHE